MNEVFYAEIYYYTVIKSCQWGGVADLFRWIFEYFLQFFTYCKHKCAVQCNKSNTSFYNRGSILIEFAFSIPVLLILLLFACDHYRIYELKNKLKASTYLAASMVQQVSNIRTDKQLIKNDIARIAYASCLNLFHTNSMFKPWLFGVAFSIDYYYVKRVNADSYQYQYGWGSTDYSTGQATPSTISCGCDDVMIKTRSEVNILHPDLVCEKDGDERLLINCAYRRMKNFNKSKLGLFLIEPGTIVGGMHTTHHAFKDFLYHNLVITPKPGLFPGK